jgi:hypothetical protein
VQDDAVPGGQLLEHAVSLAARHRLGRGALGGIVVAEQRPGLGQRHEVRPLLGDRLLDQGARLLEIAGLVALRVHLDQRDLHRPASRSDHSRD